ncbi:MAG: histidinol-phosphate transaminase [Rikenellaceae bacterium]
MMELDKLIRPNILALSPYSTARDEYAGGTIATFLDANESPYDNGLNRYPDPHHHLLRNKLSKIKGVTADSIFIGNGSDEPIDIIYRVFCRPTIDNVVMIAPTYGMYKVSAAINDVEIREVALDAEFSLQADKVLKATDNNTKVIFLCSPNNPSANILSRDEVSKIAEGFNGIVVIDEAYVDFCTDYRSFLKDLTLYDNIIVLQTLSKAWGMAGVRFGMAFASPDIIMVMNKVKYPYNINTLTQKRVLAELDKVEEVHIRCQEIISEREKLIKELQKITEIEKIFPSDANFVLVKTADPNKLYNYLVCNGVIVRNRNSIFLCEGCLRITVGKSDENQKIIKLLKSYEW